MVSEGREGEGGKEGEEGKGEGVVEERGMEGEGKGRDDPPIPILQCWQLCTECDKRFQAR